MPSDSTMMDVTHSLNKCKLTLTERFWYKGTGHWLWYGVESWVPNVVPGMHHMLYMPIVLHALRSHHPICLYPSE